MCERGESRRLKEMWGVERTEDERRKRIDIRRETYCKLGDVEDVKQKIR